MNKKQLIVAWAIILLSFFIEPFTFAQDAVTYASSKQLKEEVDWDKIDYNLFQELKKEYGKDDSEIYQIIGITYLKQENWDRAAIYFKKAVDLNPALFMSWYNLALLNMDTEEGNSCLRKAIEAKPDYPPPYYWLAYNFCRHNRDKEAIPLWKKYIEIARGDPNESARLEVATKVLKELDSGKDGEELEKIRMPNE